MTAYTDPPKESFQLSQLIHDTRYRSYTFQFIALVLLLFGLGNLWADYRVRKRHGGFRL